MTEYQHVEGVTKCETMYTHAKYALKFEVHRLFFFFLHISGVLADEVSRKAAGEYFISLVCFHLVPAASIRCCNFRLNFLLTEGWPYSKHF